MTTSEQHLYITGENISLYPSALSHLKTVMDKGVSPTLDMNMTSASKMFFNNLYWLEHNPAVVEALLQVGADFQIVDPVTEPTERFVASLVAEMRNRPDEIFRNWGVLNYYGAANGGDVRQTAFEQWLMENDAKVAEAFADIVATNLFPEAYVDDGNEGWFLNGQTAAQAKEYETDEDDGETIMANVLAENCFWDSYPLDMPTMIAVRV